MKKLCRRAVSLHGNGEALLCMPQLAHFIEPKLRDRPVAEQLSEWARDYQRKVLFALVSSA